MKKLMTAMAICAAASYSLAAGSVTSANVVGYSSVALGANKLFMFGANFEKVGSTPGQALTLADLAPSVAFADFDNIQFGVANASGKVIFTDYFYLSYMEPAGWYADDLATYAGGVQIPAGTAIWMQLASTQNVTVGGQVRSSSTVFSFLANKLTMAASAYPIAFNPNQNCVWTGLQDFDNIQTGLANASGKVIFTDYFYLSYMEPAGWYADDLATYVGSIASVGQGFWVNTQGPVSMTQSSPIP